MLSRSSSVDCLNIKTVSFSSIIQLGDSTHINSLSRVLAIQKETDTFYGSEGSFQEYRIFTEPIPISPLNENIVIQTRNMNPIIKVGRIDIIGVSAASTIQIGNNKTVYQESRVKHIRHLQSRDQEED
jgi:spore germination protein PE